MMQACPGIPLEARADSTLEAIEVLVTICSAPRTSTYASVLLLANENPMETCSHHLNHTTSFVLFGIFNLYEDLGLGREDLSGQWSVRWSHLKVYSGFIKKKYYGNKKYMGCIFFTYPAFC